MTAREISIRVAAAMFSALISLLFVEFAFRIIDDKEVFVVRNWVTEALERNTESHSARYDALLGWSGKPNLQIQGIKLDNPDIPDMSDVTVTTNTMGYRNTGDTTKEVNAKRPIFVVGDSFTWGSEVSDLDSYPSHLQNITRRRVINLAYGGWGTDQMWLRLKDAVNHDIPSLAIISPLTNDVLRNAYRRYGRAFKPYYVIKGNNLLLKNSPVPKNSSRPEDIGKWQAIFGWFYTATVVARALKLEEIWINKNLLLDKVHSNEMSVEIACRLLSEAANLSKVRGFPVVLALLYGEGEISHGKRHWFTNRYIECARETGIPLIDTYDVFLEASKDKSSFPASHYRVWKNGSVGHMNSMGNRLVALTIASGLEKLGYLD